MGYTKVYSGITIKTKTPIFNPTLILQRYDEFTSAFRPTATKSTHIEVMQAIGEVKRLEKEWQGAKSKHKQDRVEKQIMDAKTRVVWMFYGKPTTMENIK